MGQSVSLKMGGAKGKKAPATPKGKRSYDVIVIGGGIGGLTAAALMAIKGKSVSLFVCIALANSAHTN